MTTSFALKFPTLVYKTPGSHPYEGGTFEYKGVANEDELAHYISQGWYLSLVEAIDGLHDESKLESLTIDPPDTAETIPHIADPVIQQFDQIVAPADKVEQAGEPLDKSGGIPADQPGGQPDNHDETINPSDDDSTDTSLVDGLTRAELKAKAKELGIDFDGRSSNAEIARLINERQQGA